MTSTYDNLREQILAGDTSITATQIDRARRDDDYERLRQEAGQRAAETAAETARQKAIANLQRRADKLTVPRDLQAAYRRFVEAGQALTAGIDDHNNKIQALNAESKQLDADVQLWPLSGRTFFDLATKEAAATAPIGSLGLSLHALHDEKVHQHRDQLQQERADRRQLGTDSSVSLDFKEQHHE